MNWNRLSLFVAFFGVILAVAAAVVYVNVPEGDSTRSIKAEAALAQLNGSYTKASDLVRHADAIRAKQDEEKNLAKWLLIAGGVFAFFGCAGFFSSLSEKKAE